LPKNDDGEFELVLGNRQLISVFLIVVILLGVFFSMGYIVGRNSPPATEAARNEKPKPDQAADSPDGSSTDVPTEAVPPVPESNATSPAESTPPQVTKPAQPAPLPAKPEPIRPKEVKSKPSPSPAPVPPPVRAAAAGEPSSGQYWQVVATSRPDAEIIAEALGKKGFHVVLAPAPKDGIFRVLVGPLADAPTQASTRTGLESAGFKNPIMRKY
jgi:cell division septation protein DedD